MNYSSVETFFRNRRLLRYKKCGARIRFLRFHSCMHRVLIQLLRISRIRSGIDLKVLRDTRKQYEGPIIYCPTHIGGMDIEMAFETIKDPCWIVLGDPREVYLNISGIMLRMNGWIPLEVQYKEDRIVAKAHMETLLEKGGNLLLFPEGAQNISVNLLLNHLYAGAVELAIKWKAQIVPIAICRDDDTYYVAIGDNIDYSKYKLEAKYRLTEELRDILATLKWEIIEKLPPMKRDNITPQTYDEFIDSILTMNTEYTLSADFVTETQFHPKGIVSNEEVFGFMKELIPSVNNAFLFRGHD